MKNQKHLFNLPADVAYLNTAYMAPQLKASREALEKAATDLEEPYKLKAANWFEPVNELRGLYSQIIGCHAPERIAITPSCSYGVANAARQIKPTRGSNIVVINGQFPSSYHAWRRLYSDFGCELRAVDPPKETQQRGRRWNEALLNAIDNNTAAVAIPPLFHADGTRFILEDVAEQCRAKGALLIVDGTQAIGAMPFDFNIIKPDAIVCSAYKWLLGPYGTGMAYYGSFFDDGIPIEENWITHQGSDDFDNLYRYNHELATTGLRYSSGQHPAFLHIPMLVAAARQVAEWTPQQISDYTKNLFRPFVEKFEALGCHFEEEAYRAPHLFGMRFNRPMDMKRLKATLEENQVYASVRADALRISLHLMNTEEDLKRLVGCVEKTN